MNHWFELRAKILKGSITCAGIRAIQSENQRSLPCSNLVHCWSCSQQWRRSLGPHQDHFSQIWEGHINIPMTIYSLATHGRRLGGINGSHGSQIIQCTNKFLSGWSNFVTGVQSWCAQSRLYIYGVQSWFWAGDACNLRHLSMVCVCVCVALFWLGKMYICKPHFIKLILLKD